MATSDSSLTLRSGAERHSVGLGAVDSLWVRERSTVTGAIVGAAVGAAGSVADSTWLCTESREGFMCGDSPQAVAGATAGAALPGGLIGHFVHKWPLRYARSPGRAVEVRSGPGGSVALVVPLP